MFSEKRAPAERDPCRIETSIRLLGSDHRTACVIVDLTEVGAGIMIEEDSALADRFYLAFPLTEEHVDERFVELRWRDGATAGVSFVRD